MGRLLHCSACLTYMDVVDITGPAIIHIACPFSEVVCVATCICWQKHMLVTSSLLPGDVRGHDVVVWLVA